MQLCTGEAEAAEAAGGGAAEVFYLGIDNSLASKSAQQVCLQHCISCCPPVCVSSCCVSWVPSP